MMQGLASCGFTASVLCGSMFDLREDFDLLSWLSLRFKGIETFGSGSLELDAQGVRVDVPVHSRLFVNDIPVVIHHGPTTRPHQPEREEHQEFLRLFESELSSFQPQVVVGYGGSGLSRAVFSTARARRIATAFMLHNFQYLGSPSFESLDQVFVPSRFAANHYRKALNLDCAVLPNLIDFDRVISPCRKPQYLTFVNPTYEKGVYVFARIADELGRRRPDIPLLVVEGRGSERVLADCGLDLRIHGNVSLMGHTPDPRQFWGVTKLCLLPSLWWENQPLVAIEAMSNGVPVIASDRGGIPEALGDSGIVLSLPDRLTPSTRVLPTVDEVMPWIEAIIGLWDDSCAYTSQSEKARQESSRWSTQELLPAYTEAFLGLKSKQGFRPVGKANPAPITRRRGSPDLSESVEECSEGHADVSSGVASRPYRVLIYRGTENLGDAIQTIALSRLLGDDTQGIYRDEAYLSVDTERTFVVNGWLGDRANMQDRNCLFAGFHVGRRFEEHAEWVRNSKFEVGCRDHHTVGLLGEAGIRSVLLGCATLTLPRYVGSRQGEFSVDCDRGGKLLSQFIGGMVLWEDQWKMAVERLELLRTAALVHTNRLHVALPCLAMGTPVVLHRDDVRGVFQPQRLSLLDSIGFPYDEPTRLDVSGWSEGYRAFLSKYLGIPLAIPHPEIVDIEMPAIHQFH